MNEWLVEAADEFWPTFEYWRSTIKSIMVTYTFCCMEAQSR